MESNVSFMENFTSIKQGALFCKKQYVIAKIL